MNNTWQLQTLVHHHTPVAAEEVQAAFIIFALHHVWHLMEHLAPSTPLWSLHFLQEEGKKKKDELNASMKRRKNDEGIF